MKRKINQKISIDPKFLDSEIKNHLFNKLQKTMIGKCSLEYGYILKINKIISIEDNLIAPANSLVIFNVIYEADILKPEVGQELVGTVCMIFKHGIFVDIYEKMKILIPSSSMESYIFKNSCFVSDNTKISVGINVKIKIVMIKYEKKNFSCIGKLMNVENI